MAARLRDGDSASEARPRGVGVHLIDHVSLDVGLRFVEIEDATFGLLLERPGFGRQMQFERRELEGVRSSCVQGFDNHLVFYAPCDSGIEIVRVLHGARDFETAFDELLDGDVQ
jgi:toxin ParE1/3/4